MKKLALIAGLAAAASAVATTASIAQNANYSAPYGYGAGGYYRTYDYRGGGPYGGAFDGNGYYPAPFDDNGSGYISGQPGPDSTIRSVR